MSTEEIGRNEVKEHGKTAVDLPNGERLRLPAFIAENTGPILREWESFARTLVPSATGMTPLALRDHIHQILEFIIRDISSDQTPKQETVKSHGKKIKSAVMSAAETHAALRLAGGFDIGQMTSEYRALRASVLKLWRRSRIIAGEQDLDDVIRFNESVDQILTESVTFYAEGVFRSKDLFIAILGHDLRSPVQSIMLSAELMAMMGGLSDKQTMLSSNIFESANRINILINTLVDVTRARFDGGVAVVLLPMDMGFVGHQIVEEVRAAHPDRTVRLNTSGILDGKWDKSRIGQALSNLLGNAVQYGFKDAPVDVSIDGNKDTVTLSVHNYGLPIPEGKISTIFNPLTRATHEGQGGPASTNLGLGLFITNEVLLAHGGTLEVSSSEKEGTTFTAKFPRVQPRRGLRLA